MIDAYRGLGGFAGNAAVGTWLYRLTLNRCLQERRKRKPLVVDSEPLELLARWEDPDYSVDPAVVAARRSQTETLQGVLDELPHGYRMALLLHDGQGLSAAELAEVTGIPLGTAKSIPVGTIHLGPMIDGTSRAHGRVPFTTNKIRRCQATPSERQVRTILSRSRASSSANHSSRPPTCPNVSRRLGIA